MNEKSVGRLLLREVGVCCLHDLVEASLVPVFILVDNSREMCWINVFLTISDFELNSF